MTGKSVYKGTVEQYLDAICELPREPLYYTEEDVYYDDIKEFKATWSPVVRVQCKDGVVYHRCFGKYIMPHSIDSGYYKKKNNKSWVSFSSYDTFEDDEDEEDDFYEENVDAKFVEQE